MTQRKLEPELCLRVEVPICAFRPHESREYQDTHAVPPPSAVYGMLLSLCGVSRQDKGQHAGVGMVLAIEGAPERARVFRKLRRGKDLESIRPDYQDLLIGMDLWIWLVSGDDLNEHTLPNFVRDALSIPQTINRSGGLSLGESSYLVDTIRIQQPAPEAILRFLVPDSSGFYNLPVWIDHSKNTNRRERFTIREMSVADGVRASWISISPQQRETR